MRKTVTIQCNHCKKDLEVIETVYNEKRRRGQKDFYHKPCFSKRDGAARWVQRTW